MNIRPRTVGIYASAIARSEMYGIFMLIFLLHVYCDIFDLDLRPCDPKSIQTTVAPYAYKSQV